MDINNVTNKLPTLEEDRKRAAQLEELLNATNRAGAGGTKAGLPGLRPRGDITKFIDMLTPGKAKKRDPLLSKPIQPPKQTNLKDSPFRPSIHLPRNFCPDCNRTDRPHDKGAINFNVYMEEIHYLRIKPGDTLISYFCQECCDKFIGSTQGNILDRDGRPYNAKQLGAERLVRIKANTQNYIKAMILANNNDIFIRQH